MNKIYTTLLVLFLGFLLVRPFIPTNAVKVAKGRPDPCQVERIKLCSNVKPGEGRVNRCLQQNAAQLGPVCRKAAMTWPTGPQIQRVCAPFIPSSCKNLSPGNGKLAECLLENDRKAQLDKNCRSAAERQMADLFWPNCKTFIGRFCKGVPWGEGRMPRCMNKKETLSAVNESCRISAEYRLASLNPKLRTDPGNAARSTTTK